VIRAAALAHLESWLTDARDPDPEQRAWKQAYGEGAVIAYERTGLVSAEEAARWRARLVDPDPFGRPDKSAVPDDARAAAERHLEGLLERVEPLRRDPDPDRLRKDTECSTAIAALHATGVFDEADYGRWQTRLLSAQAPWIEDPEPPPSGAMVAIWVPPETEEQEREDAEQEAAMAARPEAREVRRVVVGSPKRRDDLAIVALVVHEDGTSVHFHYLGPPWPTTDELSTPDAFSQTLDSLSPPTLRDDSGTEYEPVGDEPSSAHGAGGMPGPDRREAITGNWLYRPAAPDTATSFTVVWRSRRWELSAGGAG
jgi:hypothetical protein